MMIRVALVGCGNMGSFIANYLDNSKKYRLVSVFDTDIKKAKNIVSSLKHKPIISKNIRELICGVDIVVEAASQEFVRESAVDVLRNGRSLLVMSVGALVDGNLLNRVKKEAEKNKCFVYIPSGAVCGVDGIKSACMDVVDAVTLTTIKPPHTFEGVEYLKHKGIHLDKIRKPTVLYYGPARRAGTLFPKNINVSTVLGLAGIGLEKTKVKIIADPYVKHNFHEISLKGKCGLISIKLVNQPSPTNPKTSYLACLSAVRLLEDIPNRIRIGN